MSDVHDLLDIHYSFSMTPFGQRLAQQIRFKRHLPAGMSNQEWVRLLGPDVNNLDHMQFTYAIAQSFIAEAAEVQPQLLHDRDKQLLLTAALIHDWAEAIVGDIPYDDKSQADEHAEQAAFEANVAQFYAGPAMSLINQARVEIIFNRYSKLGRMFNAIEDIGYLTTALAAAEHIVEGTVQQNVGINLIRLVGDVLRNQITSQLITHAAALVPVAHHLRRKQADIIRAYALVSDNIAVFEGFGEKAQSAEEAFRVAKVTWESWVASTSSLPYIALRSKNSMQL